MIDRSEVLEAYLLVLLGSGLGGTARYWLSGFVARRIGEVFPWGTFVVNATGCLIIGLLDVLISPSDPFLGGAAGRQFVIVGLCGGYTTFSSFSLQTLNLMRDGEWGRAIGNVVGSVAGCLLTVWLGHAAGLLLIGQGKWV